MPRLPEGVKKVLDAKYAKKAARDYDLKVTLRKNKKGYSLYAKENLRKGATIAYYKFLVHKFDNSFGGYKNDMYAMTVYTKGGRENPRLIGDVYAGSTPPPRYGIPFWGFFSNEPSGRQEGNADLDLNLKSNFKNRDRVKAGETMIYKIVATRDIKRGEEISYCYGSTYIRGYKANCD